MDNKKEKISSAAKNYADAIVGMIKDNDLTFDDVAKDLNVISEALENSKDLSAVMINPSINLEVKKDIIISVFKGRISDSLLNFLQILVDKNRIGEFPQIYAQFIIRMNEVNNIQPVTVISAVELSSEQKSGLVSKLSDKLNKTILPDWQVDESIIAGIVIKIYDNVIDMSVKHRIDKLNKSLLLSDK